MCVNEEVNVLFENLYEKGWIFFSRVEIFLSALREKRRRLPLYLEGSLMKKYAQAKKRKR